jgi:hypothetical protein
MPCVGKCHVASFFFDLELYCKFSSHCLLIISQPAGSVFAHGLKMVATNTRQYQRPGLAPAAALFMPSATLFEITDTTHRGAPAQALDWLNQVYDGTKDRD